jgi:hypothetical protein
MWHLSCMSETWGSDFDIFMEICSLMPFNWLSSRALPCLCYRTWTRNMFTHSRHKKGKITKRGVHWWSPVRPAHSRHKKGKITKRGVHWWSPVWPVTGTGLTGAGPVSQMGGWPDSCAWVTRYASVCRRVTRPLWPGDPGVNCFSWKRVIWRQR